MTWWQVVLVVYAWMSAVAVGVYAWDKWKARVGGERVSERVLLWCAMLGGWPGAWVAMRVFRHKTVKVGFRVWFGVVVGVHVLGWVVWVVWVVWRVRG